MKALSCVFCRWAGASATLLWVLTAACAHMAPSQMPATRPRKMNGQKQVCGCPNLCKLQVGWCFSDLIVGIDGSLRTYGTFTDASHQAQLQT